MPTKYEQSIICLINFRASRGWRDEAHRQARRRGLNLTEYIKYLVDQDADAEQWEDIADDLYQQLTRHPEPVPQEVTNATSRYDRRKQARW